MRRILICILVGIICYSTLKSILPVPPKLSYAYSVLIDNVQGSVTAGNFTHWSLGLEGHLTVELLSTVGDADLFVSDTRPSYEPDRNNFSSESCGVDVVYIPDDFPRPIGVGVFGHWSYPMSQFSLKVYMDVVTLNSVYQNTSSINNDKIMSTYTEIDRWHIALIRGDISEIPDLDLDDVEDDNEDEEEKKTQWMKEFARLDTIFDVFVF